MGALKSEFQEVIAGEYGAMEDLEESYHAAYDTYFALHSRLPVYRSRDQQRALDVAYSAMSWAKWRLDQARNWAAYHRN